MRTTCSVHACLAVCCLFFSNTTRYFSMQLYFSMFCSVVVCCALCRRESKHCAKYVTRRRRRLTYDRRFAETEVHRNPLCCRLFQQTRCEMTKKCKKCMTVSACLIMIRRVARVVKSVDTRDLKSLDHKSCRFESGPGHHSFVSNANDDDVNICDGYS